MNPPLCHYSRREPMRMYPHGLFCVTSTILRYVWTRLRLDYSETSEAAPITVFCVLLLLAVQLSADLGYLLRSCRTSRGIYLGGTLSNEIGCLLQIERDSADRRNPVVSASPSGRRLRQFRSHLTRHLWKRDVGKVDHNLMSRGELIASQEIGQFVFLHVVVK